jgi:hypothetical protein
VHARIITFGIEDLAHEAFAEQALQVAPSFLDLPGLLAKVWLGERETGVYGGIYLFESRAAADAALETPQFRSIGAHPNFRDVVVRELGVLDGPTAVTAGGLCATATA